MSARGVLAAAALLSIFATPAAAAVEIQWWHAMQGERGRQVEKLANDFNATQKRRLSPHLVWRLVATLAK